MERSVIILSGSYHAFCELYSKRRQMLLILWFSVVQNAMHKC